MIHYTFWNYNTPFTLSVISLIDVQQYYNLRFFSSGNRNYFNKNDS